MNYLKTAAIGSGLAGVSHMTLQAYSHFGMHFYFIGFLAVGLVQILLGLLLWKGKLTRELFWLTVLVNGGSTIFWFLTRTMTSPFMVGVEHFTMIGVAVVVLQILAIICVCLERKNLIHFIVVIVGSVSLGFAAHFGAMQLEHHFPELKGTGGHHGGGHHSTMSAEEHSNMMNHDDGKSKEDHDHAECFNGACPLPNAQTETVDETTTENLEVTQVEAEVQAEGDHHDEPHDH